MSSIVIDVLYIKKIERTIGRKLDAEELERIRFGEPIHVEAKNGFFLRYDVPTYRMPHDLSPESIDYEDIQKRELKHFAKYGREIDGDTVGSKPKGVSRVGRYE